MVDSEEATVLTVYIMVDSEDAQRSMVASSESTMMHNERVVQPVRCASSEHSSELYCGQSARSQRH